MPTRDFLLYKQKTNQDYYAMGSNHIETLTRYNRAQTMLFMLHFNHHFYIFIIDININLYLLHNLCTNKYYNVIFRD